MKIFSDNIDSLQEEIDLIKDKLITTSPRGLNDIFEMLEGFYQVMYNVGKEEDLETAEILLGNKKFREKRLKERQMLHKKNINNFIKDKAMHNSFSGKIIELYDKDFKYFNPKRLYLKENQMAEIICDFLNDEFNQADKFIELAEDGRIFKNDIASDEDSLLAIGGYTMYDYINKKSFVVVTDDPKIWDVNMMRIIVHEFGHVADNFERDNASRNQNVRYYWWSSYPEVYSMLYEKLFFDYLIKNNMFKENAYAGLKSFYMDVFDNFNNIEYLSTLEDKLLINERYKRNNSLTDQIQVDEDGSLYISSAVLEGFNETKSYSYGGLLAVYFSFLKHNDIDLFNKNFNEFKSRRFNLFDFKIFEDIGTNIDEIVNIYDKGLDEVADNKKLILK